MANMSKQIESLSPKQRELVAILLREKKTRESSRSQSIPARPMARRGPLSFSQESLWFIEQISNGTAAYNLAGLFRLMGPVNIECLRACISEVIRRHEVLWATFATVEGHPVQVRAERQPDCFALVDLVQSEDSLGLGRDLANRILGRPFDLVNGPLFESVVVKLAEGDHLLVMAMHHIVSDGWSLRILINEVVGLHNRFSN